MQNMRIASEKKDNLSLFAALYAFRRAIELENIKDDPCWRESGILPPSRITPQGLSGF